MTSNLPSESTVANEVDEETGEDLTCFAVTIKVQRTRLIHVDIQAAHVCIELRLQLRLLVDRVF